MIHNIGEIPESIFSPLTQLQITQHSHHSHIYTSSTPLTTHIDTSTHHTYTHYSPPTPLSPPTTHLHNYKSHTHHFHHPHKYTHHAPLSPPTSLHTPLHTHTPHSLPTPTPPTHQTPFSHSYLVFPAYLSQLSELNSVLTLAQQISCDLHTSVSHKYIAHQTALLYVITPTTISVVYCIAARTRARARARARAGIATCATV